MNRAVVFLLLTCCMAILPVTVTQASADDEVAYAEDHRKLVELFDQERVEEGITLLYKMKEKYPSHLFATTYNLGLFYAHLGRFDEAMDAWEEGLDAGVWYMFNLEWKTFAPLKGNSRFEQIQKRCENRREQAKRTAKASFEVALPEGYDASRRYPLFIALHGGNCNSQRLRRWWHSPRLSEEYLVVYLQSSQVAYGDGRFGWDDPEAGLRDVARLYHEILREYPVAVDQIYVGGFSQGGSLALDVALSNIIPVSGVVALAPHGKNKKQMCPKKARRAARKGLKAVVLAGKADKAFAEQELMVEILDKAGVSHRFLVRESGAYGIPEDFSALLDQALRFVSE